MEIYPTILLLNGVVRIWASGKYVKVGKILIENDIENKNCLHNKG